MSPAGDDPIPHDRCVTPGIDPQVERIHEAVFDLVLDHGPQDVGLALLEDPELFATPLPPLDELLHNPLRRDVDLEHWRDIAVGQQVASVGFWVDGIPEALHRELEARSRRYGMTTAQFIVALLGTLAWRTPFAEDMEPWDDWDPYRTTAPVSALDGQAEP